MWEDCFLAILAGFCIGLGVRYFCGCGMPSPKGNVVGALLFTIGLFTICTWGYAAVYGQGLLPV